MAEKVSRSEYVVRNAAATVAAQGVKTALSFVTRTAFIWVLGEEGLGINSLFTEVLTVFSFAELGIGTAFVYSLYRPLAENDTEHLKSLMRLYSQAYRTIGLIIAACGLLFLPFVKALVGDVSISDGVVYAVYLLYVFNTAVSYFFTYKTSLITADQKNYVVTIATEAIHLVAVVVQVVLLYTVGSYLLYMVISVTQTVSTNVFLAWRADKMYPFLKDKDVAPLPKEERTRIVEDVKALVVYKLAGSLLNGVDGVFISALVNVVTVGYYSNYKIIMNLFQTIGSNVMNSITASVGNLGADATPERKEGVFNGLLCVCAWFFGLTAVGMFLLINPLIEIWIGEGYCLDTVSVAMICLMYYVTNMHNPCVVYRSATGVFKYGKYGPAISAVIDIVLDFALGITLGLPGIFLATIISRLAAIEIMDPYVIYTRVFKSNPLRYLARYVGYLCLVLVGCAVSWLAVQALGFGGLLGFAVNVVVVTICFSGVFLLVAWWLPDSDVLKQFGGRMLAKLKGRVSA